MSTKVEAQGGELVIRNTHGDVVIIPRNKRREACNHPKDVKFFAM